MVWLIVLTVAISLHKALGFYFWHDDFSVFYYARVQCLGGWPYKGYCSIFGFLEKFFNYQAQAYFFLGLVVFIVFCITFWLFSKSFEQKKPLLLTTLLLSTGYIGAGTFLEAYDPITSFLSLALLFSSLSFLNGVSINQRSGFNLIYSLGLFALSIVVLRVRSLTFILVYLAHLYIFGGWSFRKKTVLGVLALIIFIYIFFIVPLGVNGLLSGRSILAGFVEIDWLSKVNYFIQSLSSFVFYDGFKEWLMPKLTDSNETKIRLIVGFLMLIGTCILMVQSRKQPKIFRLRLFSLCWVIALYLPYGLKSDWRLDSVNRYLLPAYPGVLWFWLTLGKKRWWLWITTVAVLANVILANVYFKPFLNKGRPRREFYSQLHTLLPTIPRGSVLFFDRPTRIGNIFEDFFRVGALPSEASVGAEYAINYSDFKIVTDRANYNKEKNALAPDKLYVFYYDGQQLINNTTQARNLLNQKRSQVFDFQKPGSGFLVPSVVNLKLAVSFADVQIPYNKELGEIEALGYLNYFADDSKIRKEVDVLYSSSSGEGTEPTVLVDGDLESFWLVNRQSWFRREPQFVKIKFKRAVLLQGLVIWSNRERNTPSEIQVYSGEEKLQTRLEKYKGAVKVGFGAVSSSNLEIVIKNTYGDENPLINEIGFVSINDQIVDIEKIPSFMGNMAQLAVSDRSESLLKEVLKFGNLVCLEWDAKGYGKGKEYFMVYPESVRNYQISLPAMGAGEVSFQFGCAGIPLNYRVLNSSLEF